MFHNHRKNGRQTFYKCVAFLYTVFLTPLSLIRNGVVFSFQSNLIVRTDMKQNVKSRLSTLSITTSQSSTRSTATYDTKLHRKERENVPYREANYDPHAADEFYKARPMKSIGRFLQIASKSSRFVFDTSVIDAAGADRSASMNSLKRSSGSEAAMTDIERKRSKELVDLITSLGPTFIKVGQALSTRTDLLPTDKAYYAVGLSELQDAVDPSFDSKEAREIIQQELGIKNIDDVFESLSDDPVASASIGQVYKGKLKKDGMEVAVKVQRPNVLESVSLDLYVMRSILAPLWTNFIDERERKKSKSSQNENTANDNDRNTNTDSVALVDAWGEGFVNELDYRAEANATKAFTKAMEERGLGSVVFAPEVVDELSSTHVLTTKWVDGERLSTSNEDDVPRLCGVALNAYLTMLLDTGTLHCDPHPGNLLRTPEGKLCILDWGMVLEVPQDLQLSLLEFIADLNAENYEDVPEDLVKLKFVPEDKLEELRKSGLTVAIAKMITLAAEGGGPKGAMKRMVAQNKEKYADALKDFDDLDSEEATKVRQRLFQEDWRREMAADAMAREGADMASSAPTSTTADLTTKIETMRQQNTDVFAIPDYFVYMSRAFATLEGIGLASNENYSILQECYPYLAKRLLSDDSPRARKALRTLLYGKDGKELDLTKLRELSDAFESYTTSTSSIESGSRKSNNQEGRNAAIEQVANVVLSEDSNYVQEILLRETAIALDATFRDALTSPLMSFIRDNPTSPTILRPFTFPLEVAKASLDLQSVDAVDQRRIENVRILSDLASGSLNRKERSNNRNTIINVVRDNGLSNSETIGKLVTEAAKRRLALTRIGFRFGKTLAEVQAERLRERSFSQSSKHLLDQSGSDLVRFLGSNGADQLESLAKVINLLDEEIGKRADNN